MSRPKSSMRGGTRAAGAEGNQAYFFYNFDAVEVWECAACRFYEFARASRLICHHVGQLRDLETRIKLEHPDVWIKPEIEYAADGSGLRHSCVYEFCIGDGHSIPIACYGVPVPRKRDPKQFCSAVWAVWRMPSFPSHCWQDKENEDEALKTRLVEAMEHEIERLPPLLLAEDTMPYRGFRSRIDDHYPDLVKYGSLIGGYFLTDLEVDDALAFQEFKAFREAKRIERGITLKKRQGGAPTIPRTELNQLGALRVRFLMKGRKFSEIRRVLGKFNDPGNFGAAWQGALQYFADNFALEDDERPICF